MLKFLELYLTESKQFGDFAGYTSTCESVKAGVPQGSVLGPLFFLVYINNLQNNTTLKVINFADDTLLYTAFKKNTYKKDNGYLYSQLKKRIKMVDLQQAQTKFKLNKIHALPLWKN